MESANTRKFYSAYLVFLIMLEFMLLAWSVFNHGVGDAISCILLLALLSTAPIKEHKEKALSGNRASLR